MPSTTTDTHTILVLGATGTVGTALVERLVDAGHVVKAATRDASGYQGPGAGTALDLTASRNSLLGGYSCCHLKQKLPARARFFWSRILGEAARPWVVRRELHREPAR